jgi:hypothetical protein
MAVLFDAADEYVGSVLDRAKVQGEISLADLESIVEAGLEAKGGHLTPDDIADTIDALANMGIEIDKGLSQEQEDAELLRLMRKRASDSRRPHVTLGDDAMASLARAIAREKAAEGAPLDPRKAGEEAAAVREVLSKRTWVQNVFAHLGPRCRRTRPRPRD